ncbi:hypothetical protein Dsin_030507 [Dipteronia sinensis]|uniref:Uncharacterized protein n=1 Tax=Dipteronia sinensis TaxID=43782 RepID=A0AAD9ZJL4_9ROSI|nr:hypothetical protein Dsin_030507 [Dipteronia sinensis]
MDARRIARVCGSPLTNNLGKYLGVPLIHRRVSNQTYSDLVEKTQKRLAAWKSDTFSLAGRATLIKTVTSALLVYTMQAAKLPSEICHKLDKLNRNFLWGHTLDKKTVHLISWDIVCMPKRNGGLGIKKMKGMNQALLAKIEWRLLHNEDEFWCKLFKHKYFHNKSLLDINHTRCGPCSSTWKCIIHGVKLLTKGLKWRIGKGDQILFWTYVWVPGMGALKDHATTSLADDILTQTVDCYMVNGVW